MDMLDTQTVIVLTVIAVYALIALVAWFVSKKKKQAQRTLWRIGPIH